MFAIMGITGQVGGAAAQALLAAGQTVRAVVRDAARAAPWEAQGAEAVVADALDADALQRAFTGVDGVFVMIPPNFAPAEGFPESRAIIAALRHALEASRPPKVVALSSVGAHRATGLGLITQLHILEEELGAQSLPTAFVRAAWFMENSLWDVAPARRTGEVPSFLQPTDRAIPMVATADIGRVVAETLRQEWTGRRVIEIAGPRPYSPDDVAAILTAQLGRPVRAVAVPRGEWAASLGAAPTAARVEMLDGFNTGWISFEGGDAEHVTGRVPMEDVLRAGTSGGD